jgi:hypothetical protein
MTAPKVQGYTEQPTLAVETVNRHKQVEELLLRMCDLLPQQTTLVIDPSWLAVARTHFEQGFMAMNRAVFRPQRIELDLGMLDELVGFMSKWDYPR